MLRLWINLITSLRGVRCVGQKSFRDITATITEIKFDGKFSRNISIFSWIIFAIFKVYLFDLIIQNPF